MKIVFTKSCAVQHPPPHLHTLILYATMAVCVWVSYKNRFMGIYNLHAPRAIYKTVAAVVEHY